MPKLTNTTSPKGAATKKPKAAKAAAGKSARGKAAPKTPKVNRHGQRGGGKMDAILALLTRPEGARLGELEKATGWQPHSVRAALTGLRKRGVEVTRERKDEVTTYRATVA